MRLNISKLLQISLVALIVGLIHFPVFAQNGTIKGTVTDATTGETIYGANVMLEGTTIGASTDMEGKFTLSNVKPGTYTLLVSFITYTTARVADVQVGSAQIVSLSIPLIEEVAEMEEITVVATREVSTDLALLKSIRESMQVVSGISAEQIKKTQDRDAAQIMQRIPGVTLTDGKFMVIRGLNSRYNTTMLNGVFAPSMETESRAFAFDIIPSGLIDQILVYKTGAAELPGEFGGGVVQINTKNTVNENFHDVNFAMGFQANTTFQSFLSQPVSKTEFLGFDGGSRALPNGAHSDYSNLGFDFDRILAESKKFQNTWSINESTARPDIRASYSMGRNFDLGRVGVSTLNSISYSNTFQYNQINRFRYSNYDADRRSVSFFRFTDDQYNNQVRASLLSNWAFQLNPSNKLEFKNFYARTGLTETTLRTGFDDDKGQEVRNYSLHYINRAIYSGQLIGTHELANDRTTLSWVAGLTTSNRSEPDWRRVSSRRNMGTENPFQVLVPQNANASDASRFYQDLSEYNITQRMDVEHKLYLGTSTEPAIWRTGYFGEYKNRSFQARSIGYIKFGNEFDTSIGALPWDEIFDRENIRIPDGLVISENSKFTDKYTASNLLLAGYSGLNLPISQKFRVIPGVRVEYNRQMLETAPAPNGQPLEVDNPIVSVLPTLNTTYNLTRNSLVRLAYSRSINRPEFREIAPFSFYDFNFEVDRIGNTDLKISKVQHLDLRWELYPTPSETVSFGVFYKQFVDPIETIIRTGANNPVLQYANAVEANNAGVEVEVRKSLAYNSSSRFINNLGVSFNGAFILSDINLGDDVTLTEQRNRPMQGQSPYIVNAGLFYDDVEKGLQFNVLYNIYGRRIFSVGDVEFPTIWEMPRHLLDLTFTKRVGQKTELRISAKDILNSRILLKEDGNLDGKINNPEVDKTILDTRNGPNVVIGFAHRF
jgi:hypothetical protein